MENDLICKPEKGIKYQVSGIKYQVSGIKYQVLRKKFRIDICRPQILYN
jgi:hypothetical protein